MVRLPVLPFVVFALAPGCVDGAVEVEGLGRFGPVRSALLVRTTLGDSDPFDHILLTERPLYCDVYGQLYPALVENGRAFADRLQSAADDHEACGIWKEFLDAEADLTAGVYVDGHHELWVAVGEVVDGAVAVGSLVADDGVTTFGVSLDYYRGNPYAGASALIDCEADSVELVSEVEDRVLTWRVVAGDFLLDPSQEMFLSGDLVQIGNGATGTLDAHAVLETCEITVD